MSQINKIIEGTRQLIRKSFVIEINFRESIINHFKHVFG